MRELESYASLMAVTLDNFSDYAIFPVGMLVLTLSV